MRCEAMGASLCTILSALFLIAVAMPGKSNAQLTASPAAVPPASKVSPALLQLRRSYLDHNVSTLTFRSMDRFFPYRAVSHGRPAWELPRADTSPGFTYGFEGRTYTPEEFQERTFTNALLVMKDGKIVYETYRNNATEQDRFIGFSMSKSITSLLVGAALAEGRIKSLDDPITAYLPELGSGGYNGVSIRHILQMRSGVYRNETYNPKDLNSQPPGSPMASLRDNISRYVDGALTVERRDPPGTVFRYMNLDSAVLGLLIERVSGTTIANYTSQHLWEPLGAESDGFFIMDGPPGIGREFNAAGFNATLRDWGRVGLLMMNKGRANGRQVISLDWVAESTRPVTGDPTLNLGYGYQWWTYPNSPAFAARGHLGQFVFIDPVTRTVVVKLSFFPGVTSETTSGPQRDAQNLSRESDAFFMAASAWQPK